MTEKKDNSTAKSKKKPNLEMKASAVKEKAKAKVAEKVATQKSPKEEVKSLKKKNESKNTITIKQVASGAGRLKNQIQTLKGLGLNKINKVATLEDTPSIRGMVKTVAHLIEVIKN
ncbi:MAG: ribosomal protein [Candidatus Midichloriaceae bacterium]|jgi:large subunit ribosomal protein L30|nr:ribosomal protein [Candidatus Midichloriaceae bacterium]